MSEIICVEVTDGLQGSQKFICPAAKFELNYVVDLQGIGEENVGDIYTLKIVKMREEELDALPEFEGF